MLAWVRRVYLLTWVRRVYLIANVHFTLSRATPYCIFKTLMIAPYNYKIALCNFNPSLSWSTSTMSFYYHILTLPLSTVFVLSTYSNHLCMQFDDFQPQAMSQSITISFLSSFAKSSSFTACTIIENNTPGTWLIKVSKDKYLVKTNEKSVVNKGK